MHSRIFEISEKPVPEDERYSFEMLPDWFFGSVADYADDIPDDHRDDEIQ